MRQLLGLLLLIGFVSCSTLNTALLSSPKKAEPTLATEPTVTIEPTKLPKDDQTPVGTTGGPSTTGFPSSTTLKTTTKPTPPPLNFEDELIVSQAPIEPMLPTANCKVKPLLNSSSFAEVVPPILKTITSSSFPTSGILSDVKKNSLHTHREKIFVRIPSEECPPEIIRKTISAFDNLRNCQGQSAMSYSASLAAEAKEWAAKTATTGVVYKPNYWTAGQYATSTSAPYALFSLDLSKFDVMAKWRDEGGKNYLPWYTGDGSSRHFSNYEWKQVREFGVGCAAYRFKEKKVIFWTIVFFKK